MVTAIHGESVRRHASMTRRAITEPSTTSWGSTGEAPSHRWFSRSAAQIRYALAIDDRVAHSQAGALGRSLGERGPKGNTRKASGTRNRRWSERWSRGSKTP